MSKALLKLSLDRIETSQWGYFEKFCSAFLVSEFSQLRTMASPSGDGGRDSELFCPTGNPVVVIQYSVAKDWRNKIRKTVDRVKENFNEARLLIFMSNHVIGGQSDSLRKEILAQGIFLDIRDQNWFLERSMADEGRIYATKELNDVIANPYLVSEELIQRPSSPLTSHEAKAALTYLGLQWQDDITDKGLTKLSFDALVRSALRHTSSESRMSRKEIHERVLQSLPAADPAKAVPLIDAALDRLKRLYIKQWQQQDEFCLSHEEHIRILIRLAEIENQEKEFKSLVAGFCENYFADLNSTPGDEIDDLQVRIPRIIEALLLHQGESFAEAVRLNKLDRIECDDLNDLIARDITVNPSSSGYIQHFPILINSVIRGLLYSPEETTSTYLRRLSNSYTLLSFLNQTPDVQAATKKLFSHGTIWLDTTVLLPLLAEKLEDDENKRRLERTFEACRGAGIEFRVTSGTIEEINSHMYNALNCSRFVPGDWHGVTPFLLKAYMNTGLGRRDFSRWLSLFKGDERPEDDIKQLLSDEYHIVAQDLEEELDSIDSEIRYALDRLWSTVHESRRNRNGYTIDDETRRILIRHDIETYLGVVALRRKETLSYLGYKHWLLTFDKNAWVVKQQLKTEFGDRCPSSPLLSMSFLANSITFGPLRSRISKAQSLSLPLILVHEMTEALTPDLMEIADRVREDHQDLPEYAIRRKVRDAIDQARRQKGISDNNLVTEIVET